MGKVDTFKEFVKKNPRLIRFVRTGDMTWQKFYEIYDLYGEEETAWKEYLLPETTAQATKTTATSSYGWSDFTEWLKSVDLDSLQEGIGSLQRVLGVVTDLTAKDATTTTKEEYKPRPLYKHFED